MATIIEDLKGKVSDIKDAKDEGEKNPTSENGEGTDKEAKKKAAGKIVKKTVGYLLAALAGAGTVFVATRAKKDDQEADESEAPAEEEEA